MDVDRKAIIGRIDGLVAIAENESRTASDMVVVELGTDSILEAVYEDGGQKHRSYLSDREKEYSQEGMMGIYAGVLRSIKLDVQAELAKGVERKISRKGFVYKFSDSDFHRIQILMDEIRALITESEDFTKEHKRRVLDKLEKLQAELHKEVSSLDMLWGLIGDAGIALGKFGENAKPFVDRIGEILQIVGRTQARAEDLEGKFPLRLLTGEQSDSSKER